MGGMVYAGLEDAGPPSGPSRETPYQSVKRDPNAYHGALDPNMGPPDAPQQQSLVKHAPPKLLGHVCSEVAGRGEPDLAQLGGETSTTLPEVHREAGQRFSSI